MLIIDYFNIINFSSIEISFTVAWLNLVPNVNNRLLHYLTDLAFRLSFLPCFDETIN